MLKKLPPRHNTAEAIHIICNQRIALLNNLCRHHCAVSLNGFDNIDTRLNRCDAHCGCAFSVRHSSTVQVVDSSLDCAFRKNNLVPATKIVPSAAIAATPDVVPFTS